MAQNENSKEPAFCGRCRSMVPINSPHECVSFGMPQEGITLRDQFAMTAPFSPITQLYGDNTAIDCEFARLCALRYEWADAMLVARRNPPK